MKNTLQITTPSDREIVFTRLFNAPRNLVFDAFTKPALIQRWLLGPPGWTMPVCEFDAHVGGKFRYVWRNAEGHDMGMGGVIREFVPPERLVCTEIFDVDWTGGETLGTSPNATATPCSRKPSTTPRVKPATAHSRQAWSKGWRSATIDSRKRCCRRPFETCWDQ